MHVTRKLSQMTGLEQRLFLCGAFFVALVMSLFYPMSVANGVVRLLQERTAKPKETMATDLDSRMREVGMTPLSEMLARIPLERWLTHAGVTDMKSFEAWLCMRREEMLRMQATMELDKREGDELYEWVIAHCAVFTEVLCNFRAANIAAAPLTPSQPRKAASW